MLEAGASADAYQLWLMQEEAKIRESAFQGSKRFCLDDIMDNPDLVNAAKQELAPKIPAPVSRPPVSPRVSMADSMVSVAESRVSRLEHMISVSENLDRDADKDAQVGSVELKTLLQRLQLGKKACIDLISYLKRLHRTETLYCASLMESAKQGVSNLGEKDGFREVTQAVIELPIKIHNAHSAIAQKLTDSIEQVEEVIKGINGLVKELESYPKKMAKDIKVKKIALSRSKLRHEVLCRKLEHVSEDDAAANRAVSDPWFTEGQVAHNYTQLIQGQANVRKLLRNAYEKVTEMETSRLETAKQVVTTLVNCYGHSITQAVQPFTRTMYMTLQEIDVDEEVDDLTQNAASNHYSERQIQSHHSEEEMMKCEEVFNSPDIVYQGTLQVLAKDAMIWTNGHFVLTRGGLYWFLNKNDASHPDDFISMSRTRIEQVKAPLIKLMEKGPNPLNGARSVVLKAPTIEDCANWTSHLRENIASFNGMRK